MANRSRLLDPDALGRARPVLRRDVLDSHDQTCIRAREFFDSSVGETGGGRWPVLFTDTEARKDLIQHVFVRDLSGNCPDFLKHAPQILR